jgi:hypothetical protein
MPETISLGTIYKELLILKKEIEFVKAHMFDPDAIMTAEEGQRYGLAMQELEEGKTTSLEDLKKELGI